MIHAPEFGGLELFMHCSRRYMGDYGCIV